MERAMSDVVTVRTPRGEEDRTPGFAPLVIGAPRSGFTLLIAVLSRIYPFTAGKRRPRLPAIRAYAGARGAGISAAIRGVFEARGLAPELVYNATFQDVAGGPKWLDPERPERACIRKYIGVRGMGDFTLITSHPREILEVYDVVHSHSKPGLWASETGYAGYAKYASLRHPAGVLNSSCHSINALTSEYLTRFRPRDAHDDGLRRQLALYKLTDPVFFEGLIDPLKQYLLEYLSCRGRFTEMKWEDLIEAPAPTIMRLAESAGVAMDRTIAAGIWDALRDRNLTGAHAHNYRRGHGRVGAWRGSLTNEHLDMLRARGMEEIARELGYGGLGSIPLASYTDFQRRVSGHLRAGTICREVDDEVLFGFAFNKSNLDSSRFSGFRSYGWREHTRVERSSFSDEKLLFEVWDTAERAVAEFNAGLHALLGTGDAMQEMPAAAPAPPRLLHHAGRWNVVAWRGEFFGIPVSLGPVDLEQQETRAARGVLRAASHGDLMAEIGRRSAWFGLRHRLGL
jgi:hypothetical protein